MVKEVYDPKKLETDLWDVLVHREVDLQGQVKHSVRVYGRGVLWGRTVTGETYWEWYWEAVNNCPYNFIQLETWAAAVRYSLEYGNAPRSWWHAAGWGLARFFRGFYA